MLALHTDAIPVDVCPDAAAFDALRRLGVRHLFVGHTRPALRRPAIAEFLRPRGWRIRGFECPLAAGLEGHSRPASTLFTAGDLAVRNHAVDTLAGFARDVSSFEQPICRLDLGGLPEVDAQRPVLVEHALDSVLPALHRVAKACPDVTFAVTSGGGANAWPAPDDLRLLLGELKRRNVAWWFDTAAGAATKAPLSDWFDGTRARLVGVTLRDAGGDDGDVPLGAGAVDFRDLADHVTADVLQVVYVHPRYGVEALEASVSFARDRGFA